ncbi:vWA domain-containing protein [Entomohabitans teleogrylli]|uniref:vWA domain-containing protein n=1 Tax=Entomohabitans teleogrylli TaxID=1384589 RepID=UPI00073D25F3|nr:VWA domain-containing protein [Entomohabitans teleogrylli]
MNLKKMCSLLAVGLISVTSGLQAAPAAPQITVKSEVASPLILENSQEKNYLKISLTGYPLDVKKRSPINLALVIDRSTSMRGDRIEKATEAAVMAVNTLDSQDTLSVVAYDSVVEVIVPATRVTNKARLTEQIRQALAPRGMTALFAGVSKGLDQVSKNLEKEQVNRIILLSDGQANVGPTSNSELAELARIAARKGVAITTIGLGQGYNEDLMTTIAQYSDGNHTFVANSSDLEKAFVREFDDVMSVVAQDVIVEIKMADQVKPVRLLGREGEIRGDAVTVKLNQLYANQEKYVLLEVVPAKGQDSQSKPLADIQVSYNNLATQKKETRQEQVAVRYTRSAEQAKEAMVEEVVAESAIQKAAIESERAIRLMDEGKMEEAKSVLGQSAVALESIPLSAPAAIERVQKSAEMNRIQAEKMQTENKDVMRKSLKEQNYNIKTQKQ